MSFRGRNVERSEDAATEFGHMVHIPDGALCRCGTRGCIEAYAADYGVLRAAYGVPDTTPPAPAVPHREYVQLMEAARRGDRNAIHAFNLAGSAIGFGINRLMTVFDPEPRRHRRPGRRSLSADAGRALEARHFRFAHRPRAGRARTSSPTATNPNRSSRGLRAKALHAISTRTCSLPCPRPANARRPE